MRDKIKRITAIQLVILITGKYVGNFNITDGRNFFAPVNGWYLDKTAIVTITKKKFNDDGEKRQISHDVNIINYLRPPASQCGEHGWL